MQPYAVFLDVAEAEHMGPSVVFIQCSQQSRRSVFVHDTQQRLALPDDVLTEAPQIVGNVIERVITH
jgi:hypothetical protein